MRACPPMQCNVAMLLQIRRRRLARLNVLGGSSATHPVSPPSTPAPTHNELATQPHSPETPVTPGSDASDQATVSKTAKRSDVSESDGDTMPSSSKVETSAAEGAFAVPDRPMESMSVMSVANVTQTRSDSDASSVQMEVDELSCAEKTVNTDIDSGIENMEVSFF